LFFTAGYWWLIPVILTTQEAEIRANSSRDLILKKPITKKRCWNGSRGKSTFLASVSS
jgi:hypothetical protein